MNINDLFDMLSRRKRKEKATVNRRLADIKREREAGHRSYKEAIKNPNSPIERRKVEAEAARKASQNILRNPMGRFLFMGEHVTGFTSSCVKSFWYDIHSKILHIEFKDSSVYGYGSEFHGVSPEMALSLWRSKSKGSWVWDRIRIRKTKLGHQIEYVMEVAPPGGRAYQQSPEAQAEHDKQVEEESVYDRFETNREQNVGRGEPEMHAPRSKKASDDRDPVTGKYRLPEP